MPTLLMHLIVGLFIFLSPTPAPPAPQPPAAVVAAAPAEVATYQIDTVHSELSFRIRHLMGRVFGTFTDWEGTLTVDPADLTTMAVDVTVRTASILTLNEQRDAHLRTPDFFAAEEYPTMTFTSDRVVQDGDRIEVHGDLTIRGTTRPVVLTGEYRGQGPDPWGNERIAFLASTTIDRHDFGVSYNQLVEGVGMIGDEVEITIAIEAVRQ
ncbi:MAG TPA: YceI family protein [Rubricoccaceae bacterium]|nr:YceI family protein [Rubricoccaceae bacterium]